MTRDEEFIYYNNLYDIYGNMLNEREKAIFHLFYEEDLSLQEIADVRHISKSAVGKTIQIIDEKLENYENKLQFMAKIDNMCTAINKIEDQDLREKLMTIIKN